MDVVKLTVLRKADSETGVISDGNGSPTYSAEWQTAKVLHADVLLVFSPRVRSLEFMSHKFGGRPILILT